MIWLERAGACQAISKRLPCCICCIVVVHFCLKRCLSRFVRSQVWDHLWLSRLTLVFEIDSSYLLRVCNEVLSDCCLEGWLASRVIGCTRAWACRGSGCICLQIIIVVDDIIRIERLDIIRHYSTSSFFCCRALTCVSTGQYPISDFSLHCLIICAKSFCWNWCDCICLSSNCLNATLVPCSFLCFSC